MKQFIKNLLSSKSPTSSKRFATLITLISIIVLAFMAAFKDDKWITPQFMFESLAWITAGGLGVTVMENFINKKTKSDPDIKSDE